MKIERDPSLPWPPGLRRAGICTLLAAVALLIWSNVVLNLQGYDAYLSPFPVAAILGWYLGWMIFAIGVLLWAVDYVQRRRA